MTTEEAFEKFWATAPPLSDADIERITKGIAKASWLASAEAATRATAQRCVEICDNSIGAVAAIIAIKKEFGL